MSSSSCSVLVLEDDQIMSDLICVVFKKHGIPTIPCFSTREAESALRENSEIGAMLVDLALPDGDGLDVLREMGQLKPGLPCFVLTAKNSVDSAVQAMKAGAQDYFTKPVDIKILVETIESAMAVFVNSRTERAHENLPLHTGNHWKSLKMRHAFENAKQAAKTQSPVLITGAPYTSKEAFARLIHGSGSRKNNPLHTLDLALMNPAQAEIELFGMPLSQAQSRPFHGASKLDKFRDATLILNNIELLSAEAQARLHQWISDHKNDIAACRLITTSPVDLSMTIKQGGFRPDLWYALTVYRVEVPCLAERPEDIPQLCEDTITRICVSKKLRRPSVTRKTLEVLIDHQWPGNLSEFYSVVEHAVTHTIDQLICPPDLPPLKKVTKSLHPQQWMAGLPIGATSIEDITKLSLVSALKACGGNRRRAAARLNVSLRTVYNMIRRYDLADS